MPFRSQATSPGGDGNAPGKPVKMFKKILIANRGEIACRIIRTARKMGIRTIAVYSEADQDALHTELADEAVYIGPASAIESYLRPDKILDAARSARADSIHPGYGFLSENPDFAAACRRAKFTFIGPPTEAIRTLADKGHARLAAIEAGIPGLGGGPVSAATVGCGCGCLRADGRALLRTGRRFEVERVP